MGAALLSYLILRAGTHRLLNNVKQMGWGILLVLGLAGISHLVKTWAWRLTLPGQFKNVSFSRTLGLRLVSEAMGQLGFVGQMVGDATRGSLLTSELPASGIISSVTLDRGLFMGTGLIVTIAGFAALLFMPAVPGGLRLYASLFAVVLVALLALSVWAIQNGWPVLSRTARLAGAHTLVQSLAAQQRGCDPVGRAAVAYVPSAGTTRVLGQHAPQFRSARAGDRRGLPDPPARGKQGHSHRRTDARGPYQAHQRRRNHQSRKRRHL